MIRLKNVSKKFDHRGIAGVTDINLDIKKGEVFCLMGPNGSGKTTLLNLISKEITPDQGTLETEDGIAFFKSSRENENDSLNVQKYLIQKNTLDIPDEKKLQMARDFADIFEFTFQLRQNFGQLSAGQKQKVELAAVLVSQPSLILLDEPFNHLDPFTRQDIFQTFFEYLNHKEISILWVTHNFDEAFKYSHRMGFMNFGKLVQTGSPLDVLSKPRDLFVAKFLGHENFVTVTKDDDQWITPWGPLKMDYPGNEAILIVPETAWVKGPSPLTTTINKAWTTLQGKKFEIQSGSLRFTIQSNSYTLSDQDALALVPDFSRVFFIPL